MPVPIVEIALNVIFESLKIIGGELGSKLERDLRAILKKEAEGREELDQSRSKKYPHYNDLDVKEAEKKIISAKTDMENFKMAYMGLLKPYLEAKK